MNNTDVIFFELNDWIYGRDYPVDESIATLVKTHQFSSDSWCKSQGICVVAGHIDMSVNWCITAPKNWIEKVCLNMLTDKSYTYDVLINTEHTVKTKLYSDFIRYPDIYGNVYGRFGWNFLSYCEKNLGVHFCDEDGLIQDRTE